MTNDVQDRLDALEEQVAVCTRSLAALTGLSEPSAPAAPVAPPRDFVPRTASRTPGGLNDQINALERRLLAEALTANRGNVQAAARALGLYRPTLYHKLQYHGLAHLARRNVRSTDATRES